MKQKTLIHSGYFWMSNVFTWLAIHAIFVHIQHAASRASGSDLSWLQTWLLLSPWFFNWIWVTASVFYAVHCIAPKKLSFVKNFSSHAVIMFTLLMSYWVCASAFSVVVRKLSFSEYWTVLVRVLSSSSQLDILIYFGVLGVAFGTQFYHKSLHDSAELKRLQHELTQEQLRSLRSQLNPHFLFNSLNTIASLVRLHREKDAVTALSELSLMLRKILENKEQTNVSIKEETAFIQSYLAIQKIRFSDKLDTNVTVENDCLDIKIPNMILHPLVENAVSHGSQLESNQNLIRLSISRNQDELKVIMTNQAAQTDDHNGFGIGMTNTRERLSKLYTHFRLESQCLNNGLYETQLFLPLGGQNV